MILSSEQKVAHENIPLPSKTFQVTKVKDDPNFPIRNETWLPVLWMLKWQLGRACSEPLSVWEKKCVEVKDWKYERLGTENFLCNSVTSHFLLKTLPRLKQCFHSVNCFAAISAWEMLTPQPHSSVYWHAALQLFAGILLLLHHLALCIYAGYSEFSLRSKSLSRGSNIHHASELPTCLFLQCPCHKILPSIK